MIEWLRFVYILGLTGLLAGCATPDAARLMHAAQDPSQAGSTQSAPALRRAMVVNVPFIPQTADHCGPAALAMMLDWGGIDIDLAAVSEMIYTPSRQGTLPPDIIAGARRQGQLVLRLNTLDDLISELAAGHPVLVFQNLGLDWHPVWHFAIAIGYDLDAGTIILHSGRERAMPLDLSTFDRTWTRAGRWALTVTPPTLLPRTAAEPAIIEAAMALEQAKHPLQAAQAYQAALARWPDSLAALVGRGNALYAGGEIEDAAAAWWHGLTRHRDNGDLWNNLAVALAELGRLDEAETAAAKAASLGGPRLTQYKETLRDVRARR